MKVSELIEELEEKFYPVNELIFVCGENYQDKPLIDYDRNGRAKIELTTYEGENWEAIADVYRACLCDLLELCDEKKLSNPKKIEAIRRRLNEEI